jgi:hypothetical protein
MLGLLATMTGCSSSKETVTATVAKASTAATSTTATTAAPSETLDAFYKRVLGYAAKGQWGREWEAMHPGQQRYVTRDKYTACANESVAELPEVLSIELVKVHDDPIDAKGVPQKSSKAVTYKVTMKVGGQKETSTEKSRVVLVEDHWKWVMSDSELAGYGKDRCP